MYKSDVPFDTAVELPLIRTQGISEPARAVVQQRCKELLLSLRVFQGLRATDLSEDVIDSLRLGAAAIERFFCLDYLLKAMDRYPYTTLMAGQWLHQRLQRRCDVLEGVEKDDILGEYVTVAAATCWRLNGSPQPAEEHLERLLMRIVADLNLWEPKRYTATWRDAILANAEPV